MPPGEINFEILRTEYKSVLGQSFKQNNIDILKSKVKSFNKTEAELKNPLDQAFRDVLLDFLQKDVPVNTLKKYVSFSIDACRNGLSTATAPVIILGDIFEALTLDGCEEMFIFVEDNVALWKEDLFFTACKNNLLRLCNDLLRRLSRATATIFCGRILLFLAKFFPFSERSGLNIVSEFNLENTTEYGSEKEQEDEKAPEKEKDEKKDITIDFTLYCKFWSLQNFFRNPTQCYDKVQWKMFISHSNSVLSTFQGLKLEYLGKTVKMTDKKQSLYFSKYLTSQKLLDLQIYDNNFRRFVLLQFLILFQYLISSVKFKSESCELKPDQRQWVVTTTEKIYSLLRETPPDGEQFAEIVQNILNREEYWNAWKNDGCPEFKKQMSSYNVDEKVKTKQETKLVGDLIKEATSQGKFYMGSSELTKLWNLNPDNLAACKGKERDFLPSLEGYFADAIAQIEQNPTVKLENTLFKDSNYGWRALRLLARRSPHFFTYSTMILNSQSCYIDTMVRKIALDQKGKVTQENNQESNAINEEMDENFLKGEVNEGNEHIKQETDEFVDDKNPRPDSKNISIAQMLFMSTKIASDWKKLASKIGYKSDEIQFFEQENPTEMERARNMLTLWFMDDEDATLENLIYILEGLEMLEAAAAIKTEFNLN